MRSLTATLQAVQSLMEARPGEWRDSDEEDDGVTQHGDMEPGGDASLFLLDVVAKSATYPVAARDSEQVLRVLRDTGEAIANPESEKWSSGMLYPIRNLSEVAQALGCQIEFRLPGSGRQMGDVIATISPETYDEIAKSAFVTGETSVYGRLERIGGATRLRCGLRVPEQPNRMIICSVSHRDLAQELGQYLYEHIVVVGTATWFRRDWVLKHVDVRGFEKPKTGSIMDALKRIHKAGGSAWDDIEDPASFLAAQRG